MDLELLIDALAPAEVVGAAPADVADLAYDARPLLPQVALPAGEFVAQTQPNARLLVFEESGHCFNAEVATFIAGL